MNCAASVTRPRWRCRAAVVALTAITTLGVFEASAQVSYPETDGSAASNNDNRANANLIPPTFGVFLNPGDSITGGTTGSSGTNGSATSPDYFQVKIAAATAPMGTAPIWKNRLTAVNSGGTSQSYTVSIQGWNQTSTGIGTTDTAVMSNSTTSPNRYAQWYGFGKSETVNLKITGLSTTAGTYSVTYSSTQVTPVNAVTTFGAGPITISTMGMSPTVDTDFWVYDENLNYVATFGNNDNSVAGGGTGSGTQSIATRTLPIGTYYVAISNSNLANNQGNPSDERTLTSAVWEGIDAVSNSSTSTNLNVQFRITDNYGNNEVVAATKVEAFDVVWAKFVVGPPQTIQATPAYSPTPVQPGVTNVLFTLATIPAPVAPNTVTSASLDLTNLGGSASQQMFDDGTHGDQTPGDGTFSVQYAVPANATSGSRSVGYTVSDNFPRTVTGSFNVGVAPANDDCAHAAVLSDSGSPNLPYAASIPIYYAGTDGQVSCGNATLLQNGIWYQYTPSFNCILEMRETGTRDVLFAVFQGDCENEIYCETTETDANTRLQAGITYYILCATPGTGSTVPTDAFVITIASNPVPAAPANDNCATATDITSSTFPLVFTIPVGGAGPDNDISCNNIDQLQSANGVLYKYTASQDVILQVQETDSTTFGQYTVYTACGGPEYACKLMGGTSYVNTPLRAGQTYYILLTRNRTGPAAADFDMNINVIPNPVPNRSCELATEVTAAPFADVQTAEFAFPSPSVSCVLRPKNAIWYRFVPSHDMTVAYSAAGSTSSSCTGTGGTCAAIVVFSGACDSLTEYYCDPAFSPLATAEMDLRLNAGQAYYFEVIRSVSSTDVSSSEMLGFKLYETSILQATPSNDLCSSAKRIAHTPYSDTIFHAGANADYRTACPAPGTATPSGQNSGVWYRYDNGPTVATAVLQTFPPNETLSKSTIAVYQGACPTGDLQEVVCNNNRDTPEAITWVMSPNTTYYMLVASSTIYRHLHGYADEQISFRFDIVPDPLPAPTHSTCSTALPMTTLPFRDIVYSANLPADNVSIACNTGSAVINNAAWYSYTTGPAESGYGVFSENSLQDAVLAVFTNCPASGELRCASFSDIGVVPLQPSTTYYFVVGRFGTATSASHEYWDFRFKVVPAAGNDTCATARAIPSFPYADSIPLVDAAGSSLLTPDTVPTTQCSISSPVQNGVWYTFTARDDFVLMGEEQGPNTSGRRWALYKVNAADPCNQALWTNVGCSTNSLTGPYGYDFTSPLMMQVRAGETYYLLVGNNTATVTNAERRFYDIILYTLGSDVGRCSTGSTCSLTIKQNCAGTFLPAAAPCPADINCASGISVQDIFDFLALYFSNDPRADFNDSGTVSVQDIFDFLAAYFGGCN